MKVKTVPKNVSAREARERIEAGALLVDIRSPDEFRREHVPGSLNIPQQVLATTPLPARALIFTCRSGGRTAACSAEIARTAGEEALILNGGLAAWKAAGGAIRIDRQQPIDLMRQVQMVAGSLVLAGVGAGLLVHPAFLGLSGFVGAGLLFAGASGWCGMARLLALMPWNRVAA